jgi:hypothetical protein
MSVPAKFGARSTNELKWPLEMAPLKNMPIVRRVIA